MWGPSRRATGIKTIRGRKKKQDERRDGSGAHELSQRFMVFEATQRIRFRFSYYDTLLPIFLPLLVFVLWDNDIIVLDHERASFRDKIYLHVKTRESLEHS